jgi:hypothetical protein
MSEREGGHLPCPQMRSPAAANGRANRRENIEPEHITETKEDRQTRSLRSRLGIGYSLAASLAPLIFGLGPH